MSESRSWFHIAKGHVSHTIRIYGVRGVAISDSLKVNALILCVFQFHLFELQTIGRSIDQRGHGRFLSFLARNRFHARNKG